MRKNIVIALAILFIISLFAPVVAAQQFSPVPGGTFTQPFFVPRTPTMPTATSPFNFTNQTKMELLDSELSEFGNMPFGTSLPAIFNLPPTFEGQNLVWTSSNSNVASVTVPSLLGKSQMALITANNPGTAVITVSTPDGRFSYSFNVVVN